MKETPCKRLRRDKTYYLNELKNNALRGKERGYNNTKERREILRNRRREVQKITGAGSKRRFWTYSEENYLKDNYNTKTILELALYLDRSWMSVMHKAERLKLKKYNNWTK